MLLLVDIFVYLVIGGSRFLIIPLVMDNSGLK